MVESLSPKLSPAFALNEALLANFLHLILLNKMVLWKGRTGQSKRWLVQCYLNLIFLSFWGEAVNTAVYIINCCPTKAVAAMTPAEAFTGVKPSVSHFKVFGCDAYVHISDHKRTKFDSKSKKCKFLGYSTQSKAYRLWDLESKSLVISRDVHFVESQPDDSRISPEFTVENPTPLESPVLDKDVSPSSPPSPPTHL